MIARTEILACRPCYALVDGDLDEAKGHAYLDRVGMAGRDAVTAREIAVAELVSIENRLWILLKVLAARRPQLAREFACDCAEEALALVPEDKRDPRSIRAIEVSRRFARGTATEEELAAARAAARAVACAAWAAAADGVKAAAADDGVKAAAWAVAWAARAAAEATEATEAVARAVAWAARAVAWAARAVAWAAWAVTEATARRRQLARLVDIFEQPQTTAPLDVRAAIGHCEENRYV